jgi:hypothetical protein
MQYRIEQNMLIFTDPGLQPATDQGVELIHGTCGIVFRPEEQAIARKVLALLEHIQEDLDALAMEHAFRAWLIMLQPAAPPNNHNGRGSGGSQEE